jgi:hypothetical protein
MRQMLALLAAAAPAAWCVADDKKPDYYPLAKGNKWEYRLVVNGAKVDVSAEVIASESKDGRRSATVESKAGAVTSKEELASDEKGVYRNSFNGVPTDKPVTIIKYPTTQETWKEKFKIMGMELSASTTARAVAEVKVAAGTYKALPVEVVAEIAGQKIIATTWYADGVGIVKQAAKFGELEVEMELTKFTPGK